MWNFRVFLCFSMLLRQGSLFDFANFASDVLRSLIKEVQHIEKIYTTYNSMSKFYDVFEIRDDIADENDDAASDPSAAANKTDYHVTMPEPPECGLGDNSEDRVVYGDDAKLGAFPWMALLNYKVEDIHLWACGGTLVSSRHVLTAAHCVYPSVVAASLSFVRLGELDYAQSDEGATPVDLAVVERILHEGYNRRTKSNDIALLVVEKKVVFTDLIKPICLPRFQAMLDMDFENSNPFAAGWGRTKAYGPSSSHLQVLQLPVLRNQACRDTFSKKYTVDASVLCAGYERGRKDTCAGDSGGPLMLPWSLNESWSQPPMYQIGVISYGVADCGKAPGVYTRITHFMPWMLAKITGNTTQQYPRA